MVAISKEEEKALRVKILNVIGEFCEKNNINYFLAFGTLLGAIREQGMIEWDYDIDVMLPRPDYRKFLELFSKQVETPRYRVKNFRSNKNFICPISIVEDLETNNITEIGMDEDDPLKRINVELYPIDGAPNSEIVYNFHMFVLTILNNILKVKVSKDNPGRATHKRIILKLLKIVAIPLSQHFLLFLIDKISTMYQFELSSMTSVATIGRLGYKTYTTKTIYDKYTYAIYEHKRFRVPMDYDSWLCKRYGNYHLLPSKKEIERSLSLKNYYQYGINNTEME